MSTEEARELMVAYLQLGIALRVIGIASYAALICALLYSWRWKRISDRLDAELGKEDRP